jgi:hypothetical protein
MRAFRRFNELVLEITMRGARSRHRLQYAAHFEAIRIKLCSGVRHLERLRNQDPLGRLVQRIKSVHQRDKIVFRHAVSPDCLFAMFLVHELGHRALSPPFLNSHSKHYGIVRNLTAT